MHTDQGDTGGRGIPEEEIQTQGWSFLPVTGEVIKQPQCSEAGIPWGVFYWEPCTQTLKDKIHIYVYAY